MQREMTTHEPRRTSALWWVVGIIILAAAIWLISSMMSLSAEERRLNEVVQNPDEFVGQAVVVEGRVNEVLNPQVITLDPPGVGRGRVVVVSQQPIVGGNLENSSLQVSGIMQKATVGDVSNQLGVDLGTSTATGPNESDEIPVIVANSVAMIENQ